MDLKKNLPKNRRKPEFLRLARALESVWTPTREALDHVLRQADLRNCSLLALYLHAWARGIRRYPGENDENFRLRALHAGEIRQEAGSLKGLKKLLRIYGATNFSIQERGDLNQWDVIEINLDPSQLSIHPKILMSIIQDYGRTCRKYYSKYTIQPELEIASAAIPQVYYVSFDS